MQKHTKIYFDYYGYDKTDFIACEICGVKATEIQNQQLDNIAQDQDDITGYILIGGGIITLGTLIFVLARR